MRLLELVHAGIILLLPKVPDIDCPVGLKSLRASAPTTPPADNWTASDSRSPAVRAGHIVTVDIVEMELFKDEAEGVNNANFSQ